MKTFRFSTSTEQWFVIGLGFLLAILGTEVSARFAVHIPSAEVPIVTNASPTAMPRDHVAATVHFDLLAKLLADDRRSAAPNEWLQELADSHPAYKIDPQCHELLGQMAPDFTLNDHHGRPWSLRSQLGGRGPVVLVFYLGYSCNACIHELFELNADLHRYHELGAEVIAISGDQSELTQQQFEKYGAFGFPVLSDSDHQVAESYGLLRPATALQPAKLLHASFIIGRDEQVHWVSCGDTPFRVDMALLYQVARLENKLPLSGRGSSSEITEVEPK